jgi:hypothetical protein
MKAGEKKVMYGLWDDEFNGLVGLPGPDGYVRHLFDDLNLLQFCLGGADASVVKVVVEPLVELVGGTSTGSNAP